MPRGEMLYRLKRLYRPEYYQGPRRGGSYFEGWYFKVAHSDGVFAVIPGVSLAAGDPHAFVQLIDVLESRSSYHRFALDEFRYGRREFSVSVGPNRFSLGGMQLDLPRFRAELSFASPALWKGSLLQPGTMGWYSFVPFMECKHGIIVLDAEVSGVVAGRSISRGRLYLEKDYGKSFPEAWVWMQANSFERPGTSVTCSIGRVPFVGGAFTGFLAGMLVDGSLLKYTTYTGARLVALHTEETSVRVTLRSPRAVLELRATRAPGAELASPSNGLMRGRIVETLGSSIEVRLTVDGVKSFEGTSGQAGLEVVRPDRLL